jgi:DNA anti-recombination protein RmuC|tara:strand:- start:15 stop:518 length:504 start_codon:yes stop_codon:yes gene_type:complete
MGLGDAIRKQITNLVNSPSRILGEKANSIVKRISGGGAGLEEAEKLLNDLKDLEKRKETLNTAKQQISNVINTVSATKITAVALKEANTIGSALNPAAAAISVIQEKLENKIEKEIEDVKSAKDAIGPALDGLGDFIEDTKKKLSKAIADKKRRDQEKKDRDQALGK